LYFKRSAAIFAWGAVVKISAIQKIWRLLLESHTLENSASDF